MKKLLITLISIFVFVNIAFAQSATDKKVDSLKNEQAKAEHIIFARILELVLISFSIYYSSPFFSKEGRGWECGVFVLKEFSYFTTPPFYPSPNFLLKQKSQGRE